MSDAEMQALRAAAEKAIKITQLHMPPTNPVDAFHQAANPAAVLALLDRVAAAERVAQASERVASDAAALVETVTAQRDAAWRAGRDAAISVVRASGYEDKSIMTVALSMLQPPADLAAAATGDAVAVKALEAIVGMIDGCADVPRAPDSLPQMIAHTAREAIRARGGSASA